MRLAGCLPDEGMQLGGDHVALLEREDERGDEDVTADEQHLILANAGGEKLTSLFAQLGPVVDRVGVLLVVGLASSEDGKDTADLCVKLQYSGVGLSAEHNTPNFSGFSL